VSDGSAKHTLVGRISGVFGIKGWVKIASFTDPQENLFEYSPWQIKLHGEWVEVSVDQVQRHKGGWIAQLKGVNDRNEAEAYKLKDIAVDRSQFAALDTGDFYWHQLVGMRVLCLQDSKAELCNLGVVHEMFETGANDVIVVRADDSSIDDRERLIPYVPEMYIKSIDLQAQQIVVDWNVED